MNDDTNVCHHEWEHIHDSGVGRETRFQCDCQSCVYVGRSEVAVVMTVHRNDDH